MTKSRSNLTNSFIEKVIAFSEIREKTPELTLEKVKKFISKIDKFRETKVSNKFEKYPDEVHKIFGDLSFKEMDEIMSKASLLLLILNSESYEKELKDIM